MASTYNEFGYYEHPHKLTSRIIFSEKMTIWYDMQCLERSLQRVRMFQPLATQGAEGGGFWIRETQARIFRSKSGQDTHPSWNLTKLAIHGTGKLLVVSMGTTEILEAQPSTE